MAQVVDIARVGSKIVGAIFFVMFLLAKDRERKIELLMLATFCMAVI